MILDETSEYSTKQEQTFYSQLFSLKITNKYCYKDLLHCVKSVQIRSFFWSVFSRIQTEYRKIRSISLYSVRMRENTEYLSVFTPNAGKYGPKKTPYLDTFHAVANIANPRGNEIKQLMLWIKIILEGNIILNINTKILELLFWFIQKMVKNNTIETIFYTFGLNMKSIFQVGLF